MKTTPNFSYEKRVWKKGFKIVAGCDEVGRGALAGPVVCGCVIFDKKTLLLMNRFISSKSGENSPSLTVYFKGKAIRGVRVDDSKKLTARQRELANRWIKKNCLAWGIGVSTVAEINRRGIVSATSSGFRRAVNDASKRLGTRIQFLLVDAFYIPYLRGLTTPRKNTRLHNKRAKNVRNLKIVGGQLAIVNGDKKSVSIAGASIIAKVYRDKLMTKLSKKPYYKKYGWGKNKGYGTKVHIGALQKFGSTGHHRKQFVRNIAVKNIAASS